MTVRDPLTIVFEEFGPIYDYAAQRGIDADALNRCEVWEVARMLGITPQGGTDKPPGPALTGEALLRARVLAAQGKGPAPKPARTTSPSVKTG